MTPMRILTYEATEPDQPGPRFIANIQARTGSKGAWEVMVVRFSASSKEDVTRIAQSWWDHEMKKAEAKRAPRKPKGGAPPPAADTDPPEAF